MSPEIRLLAEKKLIGIHLTMSLADNKTPQLWKSFIPRRREISNSLNTDLISLQIYPVNYFSEFSPGKEFEKWALVEVTEQDELPEGMEGYNLPGGYYAVFDYKGPPNDPGIFQFIFQTWLPSSEFVLDDRPHFEVLGARYDNSSPDSEEEIWIPVKLRNKPENF